ncbi:MAG: TRAP transporter substrate-binding protein [bacterium]
MAPPIHIRFAGYSPPETSHSRAAVRFREALAARLGEAARVDIYWNVLDFGYKAEDLLSMVECGVLTMCYFSTSYLAARVPELEIIDLPFLFENEAQAHAALDGALGGRLTRETEARTGYRILGYWDNGFRHLTNRLRPVRTPADCAGLRVRLQPNDVHVKTFELLGAAPVPTGLKEGIAMIEAGEVDAQENPLANTATYGVHRRHPHLTLTGHFYGARGLYVHREGFDAWPEEVRAAVTEAAREAISAQREMAAAEEGEVRARLEAEGVAFVDLTPEERAAFVRATAPIIEEARARLGEPLFALLG